MKMSTSERNDTWKLIQPELLSPLELIQILRERQVTVEECDISNKSRLVELFKRVATPLPQRNRFASSGVQQRNVKGTNQMKITPNGTAQTVYMTNKLSTIQINRTPPLVNPCTKSIKLKRTSEAMQPEQGCNVQNSSGEPTPKKREKITWP